MVPSCGRAVQRRGHPPRHLRGGPLSGRAGTAPVRRGVGVGVLLVVLGAVSLFHAPAAVAHEFRVTVIVPDGPDGDEAWAGVRFAVDRSPDVSHPSGVESGDHLGGVDVELEVLRARRAGGDLESELRAALSRGSSIVALIGSDNTSADARVGEVAAEADAVFVASRVATAPPAGSIVMMPRSDGHTGRAADVEAAFTAAHGRAATDFVLAGYDVATLIDTLVAALGHNLEPGDIGTEVVRRTDNVLTSTVATIAGGGSDAGEAAASGTPRDERADARTGVPLVVFVASGATLALATLALLRHRRRRDRGVPRGSESPP